MAKLVIVRHGQTEWNTLGKEQGHLDSPLTAYGIEFAERLGLRLRGVPFARVICSTQGRAMQTADIICRITGDRYETDARLMELGTGSWQTRSMRDIAAEYGVQVLDLMRDLDTFYARRGGESYAGDMIGRVSAFLDDMRGIDGNVLVITHGVTLRAFRQIALGLPSNESMIDAPSACLCELEQTDAGVEINVFGDYFHHSADVKTIWHGSPLDTLEELRAGSTVTRIRPLAEAFSHKPSRLNIATDGAAITHNGAARGWLYRVAEPVSPDDLYQHPRTAMPLSYEMLTRRPLRLERVAALEPDAPLTLPQLDPRFQTKC